MREERQFINKPAFFLFHGPTLRLCQHCLQRVFSRTEPTHDAPTGLLSASFLPASLSSSLIMFPGFICISLHLNFCIRVCFSGKLNLKFLRNHTREYVFCYFLSIFRQRSESTYLKISALFESLLYS